MSPRRSPRFAALARARAAALANDQPPARPVTPAPPEPTPTGGASRGSGLLRPAPATRAPASAIERGLEVPRGESGAATELHDGHPAHPGDASGPSGGPSGGPTADASSTHSDSAGTPVSRPPASQIPTSTPLPGVASRPHTVPTLFSTMTPRFPVDVLPASIPAQVFQFPDLPTPSPSMPVPSPDVDLLPPGGKPSRKNLTIELFSGAVPIGGFDSGVRRWWSKFLDQLSDAQIIDGHKWSDVQCRSLFAGSLTGDAAVWYSTTRAVYPQLSLANAGSRSIRRSYQNKS